MYQCMPVNVKECFTEKYNNYFSNPKRMNNDSILIQHKVYDNKSNLKPQKNYIKTFYNTVVFLLSCWSYFDEKVRNQIL